jgi:hypothetical protein
VRLDIACPPAAEGLQEMHFDGETNKREERHGHNPDAGPSGCRSNGATDDCCGHRHEPPKGFGVPVRSGHFTKVGRSEVLRYLSDL